MIATSTTPLLDSIGDPEDLRRLPVSALRQLADELRIETIDAVSITGGHLGAGLGVIELTVALHNVFETPVDKIIWDVGHQAYPHKILTGRRDRIRTLRQPGGLSGFTKRSESPYDPFGAAHSSTSISAGLGMAVARDLAGDDSHVVCVIGDGAMSAGMAFEAMNNAGASGRRLIVILNDNAMSIAPAVGALAEYLARIVPKHSTGKRKLGRRPARAAGDWFRDLGFDYTGPIDGHDLAVLVPALEAARNAEYGPILLHVVTEKGKGYAPAEASADRYHGVNTFNVVTGAQAKARPKAPSYTRVFADALIGLARHDPKIVAITAAMPNGTGLDLFEREFPDRFFDTGIAEQHAVTFAAGLATQGFKPFAAIYSTFLQRAYDQIVHDVALQHLPVRFAIDRAGLVGADGATHAGSFDLGYLCNLPGFVIMAAADEAELVRMVATAATIDDGPSAFRYPRGDGTGVDIPANCAPLEIGRGRLLREGTSVALLSLGTRLGECMMAANRLDAMGLSTTVADARFAKPLDTLLIARLAREHELLITVEEGAMGGFGAMVSHHLSQTGLLDHGVRFRSAVLPDVFMDQNKPEAMYAQAGLDAAGIAAMALKALGLAAVEYMPDRFPCAVTA